MHETPVARRLLHAAQLAAAGENATITTVSVEIGPGHLSPASLELTLRALAHEGALAHAAFRIEQNTRAEPDTARLVSISVADS